MKKLLVLCLCLFLIAADLPPQLPSSFYGWITPNQSAGTQVSAWVGNVKVASKPVMQYNGATVYALNVLCSEGDIITFKVGAAVGGMSVCHPGTNVRLDLNVQARLLKRK